MEKLYQKEYYNDLPGFFVRHTAGPNAANSTTGYLHLNANRMLLYFIQGSGNLLVADKAYRIQAGDVILTDSAELFHCSIDPGVYHERLSIHMRPQFWRDFPCDMGPLFRSFTDRNKGDGNLIPAETVKSSGLGAALTEFFSVVQQDSPPLALAKLIQLLDLLDGLTGIIEPQLPQKDLPIHQVLQYLNAHCAEDISINRVAAAFHITPSYLAHWFKRHTGLSPWNYVILRRLQQANYFMSQGCSAEDACYRVGFDNYANFFRLYKKHTGITPSQFKKQIR